VGQAVAALAFREGMSQMAAMASENLYHKLAAH
jgi:hypothetical protein